MEVSGFVRSLLEKRGVESSHEVAAFLQPDFLLHTHSPNLLSGMDTAIARLFSALAESERIAIYADFDCDGIPGAALLSDFFAKIGYENFEVYLPHRDTEGYGFHQEAIRVLATRGVKLIITVDVGTTAVDAVRFAKEKGIDCIITDHHEITGSLPDAVAILNPKLGAPALSGVEGYPFRDLCGSAVAFKFVQAALLEGRARRVEAFLKIPEGWEKWLLDLVAIATVADMVPLVGENRVLAFWGLLVLRKSPRAGITALCNKLRIRKSEITEETIGFSIAPRINAASRMDKPSLALSLLITRDAHEADTIAAELERLNARRKGVVGGIVREAKKKVKERYGAEDSVVVLGNPEWKPALLGLAANSIMEERGGLVCLWGRDGSGRIKGSCRSDGALSVVDVFSNAREHFEEFGGHAASGGFTLTENSVHTLEASLTKISRQLTGTLEKKETPHMYDASIPLREISRALYDELAVLAPFGIGNSKPIFLIKNVRVEETRRFGKENNHVEVMLSCLESSARVRAFDFFRSPDDFSHVPLKGAPVSVLSTIERDTFRGGLALRLLDVVQA